MKFLSSQIPVIEWMKALFCLDYVDMITDPGMDGVLAHGNLVEQLSKTLVVVGHYDCAANPVSSCEHIRDIAISVNLVKA